MSDTSDAENDPVLRTFSELQAHPREIIDDIVASGKMGFITKHGRFILRIRSVEISVPVTATPMAEFATAPIAFVQALCESDNRDALLALESGTVVHMHAFTNEEVARWMSAAMSQIISEMNIS